MEKLRNEILGAMLVLLVAGSLGVGFLIGTGNQHTITTTATVTQSTTMVTVIQTALSNTADTTNVSLGLTFSLVLNSTVLQRGQTVNITVYLTNALSITNNRTAANDWAEGWLIGWIHIDSCNSFANAQVFQGYYTRSNISSIQNGPGPYGLQLANPLFPPLECPSSPGAWSTFFPFQPHANRVGYQYSANGYYINPLTTSSTFTLFDPGFYTIAAGDEWGQLVILHFVVTS